MLVDVLDEVRELLAEYTRPRGVHRALAEQGRTVHSTVLLVELVRELMKGHVVSVVASAAEIYEVRLDRDTPRRLRNEA